MRSDADPVWIPIQRKVSRSSNRLECELCYEFIKRGQELIRYDEGWVHAFCFEEFEPTLFPTTESVE